MIADDAMSNTTRRSLSKFLDALVHDATRSIDMGARGQLDYHPSMLAGAWDQHDVDNAIPEVRYGCE